MKNSNHFINNLFQQKYTTYKLKDYKTYANY